MSLREITLWVNSFRKDLVKKIGLTDLSSIRSKFTFINNKDYREEYIIEARTSSNKSFSRWLPKEESN
jgi:hypothetical protein